MAGESARIVIDMDAQQVVVESAKAKRAIAGLGNQTQAAGKQGQVMAAVGARQAQSMQELARVARRATFVLGTLAGAGIGHVIKTGVEFEQEMSRVKAVLGATGAEMTELTKLAAKMGAETKFSASESASAMYQLASAGFTAKEMAGAMEGTLALAAASNIELADASEIAANALRGFGLKTSESGHVADVLAEAVNRSSVEMSHLQLSMKYIGPIARNSGQSFESMAAALAIMGDAGIKGEQAGTTLRGAMTRLINPVGQAKKGLEKLGLSAKDLQGPDGLLPLADLVELFEERTKNLTAAERNQAMAMIFGAEALSGMSALMSAGSDDVDKLTTAFEKSDGAAKRAATTMQDNVAGAWEQLTGSIETTEVALYQQFQEPLKEVLLEATRMVNTEGAKVEEFFDRVFDMPEFQAADLGGKLGILLRELEETGLPDKIRDVVLDGFADALSAAVPVIAEGAVDLAVVAAKAFGHAFMESSPLARVVLATWLLHKAGGLAAFRASGVAAGGSFATGVTAGTAAGMPAAAAATAGAWRRMSGGAMLFVPGQQAGQQFARGAAVGTKAAAGGWKATAAGIGKQVGIAAAIAAAVAYGPELVKQMDTVGDFDLPVRSLGEKFRDKITFGLTAEIRSAFDKAREEAKRAVEGLEAEFERLNEAGDSAGLARLADQADAAAQRFPELADHFREFGTTAREAANEAADAGGEITTALSDVAAQGGKHLTDIRGYTARAMIAIKKRLGEDSAAGKDAMAKNFHASAEAVRASMEAGKISTKTGLREIRKLMVKSLELYGISAGAAKALVAKQQSSSYGGGGLARGGLVQVGQPGEAGRDDVPALLNGRPHVVARGENVAVFTRHQKQVADQQLAGMGGLSGLFSSVNKPNYMARGGFVQGAMSRGLTGKTLGFANRMFARGFSVTDAFRPGGSTNHGDGTALDFGNSVNDMRRLGAILIPMRAQFEELFGPGGSWKFGKPIPQVPGHGDHWHVALLDGAKGAITGLIDKIKRVKVPTDMGVVSNASQAAVDTVRAAANKRLEDVAMSVAGGHGAGQAAAPEQVRRWAAMALRRENWYSEGNLSALVSRIMQESGGNPRAVNNWDINAWRGDPSKGLAQTIGATFQAYRDKSLPNDPFHPLANLVAALRYMRSRYGRVVGANGQGYARGGMVAPFVGSYETGGTIPQDGFAYVHKGEEVTPKAMAAGGFVGPHRRLARLVGLRLDAEIRSGRTLEGFKGVLDDLENVVPEHIRSLQKRVRAAMADLRKGGVTTKERQRYDQLKDALGAVDEEADRRLDLISDSISRAVDRAKDAISEVELRMRVEGIDNDSAQGLERVAAAQRALRDSIAGQIAKVQRAIARAQREGRTEAEGQLREQLTGLQRSLLETTASLADNARAHAQAIADAVRAAAEAARARVEAQIDARAFHVEGVRHRADLAVRGLELRQRLAGNQDTPEAMRARAAAVEQHTIPALQHQVGTLWQNWLDLATAGFHGDAERVKREARSAEMDVLAAQADAADLLRQAADAQKQAAEESQRALNDLLKEQLQAERERRRLAEAQFPVFAGFAGLAMGRLVGRFPHGADFVHRTGLAEIHRGEMIIPDPVGPYRSRGREMTKPPPPPTIQLTFTDRSGDLVRLIDARVDGRAARVVSDQLGRRAQQFTTAPGR